MIRRSAITGDKVAVLQRAALQDARISFRALGILCYVLSRPPDWRTSSEQLARERKEGRDAIRSALRELEACGYLYRYNTRDDKGRFHKCWDLSDEPLTTDSQDPENDVPAGQTDDGFPAVGSPAVGPPVVLLGVETGGRDTPPTPSPAQPPPSPARRQEEEPEPAGKKTTDRQMGSSLQELRTALADGLVAAGAGGLSGKVQSASGRPFREALERLWGAGTTGRELGAAVRGREWDGVGLGAVVVWLRGLDPAELLYLGEPAVPPAVLPAVVRERPGAVEGVPVPPDFRDRIGRTR